MPRPLASLFSLLFVLGIAAVLTLPVFTASGELVLKTRPFDGLVGMGSHTAQRFATLHKDRTDGVGWSLNVTDRPNRLCVTLDTDLDPAEGAALMCTESPIEGAGATQFIPASDTWRTSVLIAMLPGDIHELRLRATDDAPLQGDLYALPSQFRSDDSVLVVFLPQATDIVEASGTSHSGGPVDLSRLIDQVDAY
jgi:hypothetical protein